MSLSMIFQVIALRGLVDRDSIETLGQRSKTKKLQKLKYLRKNLNRQKVDEYENSEEARENFGFNPSRAILQGIEWKNLLVDLIKNNLDTDPTG